MSGIWLDLLRAGSLVLVFEGIMPFLSPARMRQTMRMMSELDDKVLRGIGFVSMLLGVALLYFLRN